MTIALLTVRLKIHGATSLKDKRAVKRSLCDRIRDRFNVAVIESGVQEDRRRLELSMAALGDSPAQLQALLERIVIFIETATDAELISVEKDYR